MALTINNFWGAETEGLEEIVSSVGTVSANTSITGRTGAACYQMESDASNTASILLDAADGSVTDQGTAHIVGFRYQRNTTGAQSLCRAVNDSGGVHCEIRIDSSDNIQLYDSGGTTVGTTGTATISANTWNYIVLYFDKSNSGTAQVWVDGVADASATGQDFLNATDSGAEVRIYAPGGAASVGYADDVYYLTGATAQSDRFDECEVFSYRSNKASTTPDSGQGDPDANLDTGQWADAQEIVFSESNVAAYTVSGFKRGVVTTDDVGGSAGTGGPSTDTNVDGDSNIKAMKGIWRMKRSGGSGAAHTGRIGNSSLSAATCVQSADFSPTASYANYFHVTETSLPTTSQYGRIGIDKTSGGQDLDCSDMLFQILHVPSAAPAGPFPYETIETQQRRIARMFNF